MKKLFRNTMLSLVLLHSVSAHFSFAQNPAPAPVQSKRILLLGGVVHTGTGTVIENGAVGFEKGRLTLVADATTIRIDRTAYDTIIDIQGKHVYPGLIALNTQLGLREIEAVRATSDYREVGAINPSVRSSIAYNTDSKVIPTVRSNGILLAQVVPQGGLVSGQSSVMELDGWNYEDALYKADQGIHLNWPSMRLRSTAGEEEIKKQRERVESEILQVRKLFSDAKAYADIGKPEEMNLHLEAMRGLFDGTKKLFVHCNFVKEIIAAAGMCEELGIKMVLVGGEDAWMVTDLLKSNSIPVVLVKTHALPAREDAGIDGPYTLAARLHKAGVLYAISVDEFWQVRTLPFQAGQAAGYGLSREEVLASVTTAPARILGIDHQTGYLEPGKDATLLVCDGDLFDVRFSKVRMAYIRGKQIDLDNIQNQLNKKYRRKYGLKTD